MLFNGFIAQILHSSASTEQRSAIDVVAHSFFSPRVRKMTIFAVTHIDDVHFVINAVLDLIERRRRILVEQVNGDEPLTARTNDGIVSIVDKR